MGVARRGLMGAAVAGVVAAGLARPAQAAVPEGRTVTRTTIAALRAATTADPEAAYLVTDPGAEGVFLPDPDDTSSADDTGLVIVTAAGERVKRVPEGHVSVRWFGARGDGQHDDAPAIQAAVDAALATGRSVYFPSVEGAYAINAPIVLPNAGPALRIHGDAMAFTRTTKGSKIIAHPSRDESNQLEALFLFDDSRTAVGYQFDNITLNGNYATRYGVKSGRLSHTTFFRVYVLRTTEGGVGIGRGWCNDFLECAFYLNTGDGIRCIDSQVNMLNITNTKIYRNSGVGIALLHGAFGVNITGCTIETNEIAGIVARTGNNTLDISSNYFERNGVTGYTDEVGLGRLVHAQIVILGGRPDGTGSATGYQGPTRVTGNIFSFGGESTNPHDNQVVVAAFDAFGGLEVAYNGLNEPRTGKTDSMVLTGTSRTGRGSRLENLTIRGNGMSDLSEVGIVWRWIHVEDEDLAGAVTALHTAAIEGTAPTNYAQPLLRFRPVGRSRAGQLVKSSERHLNRPVHQIKGATETGEWGFTLDLAAHPELAGRLVYFACTVRASDEDTGVVLSTSQLGDRPAVTGTEWQVVSYVDRLPESGTVTFGVRKSGGSDTSTVSIARPVLAEVGVRYELAETV